MSLIVGAFAAASSAVVFPMTLSLIRRAVLVPLRVRAHQKILGTIAGTATVLTAGYASAATFTVITSNEDTVSHVGRFLFGIKRPEQADQPQSQKLGHKQPHEVSVAEKFEAAVSTLRDAAERAYDAAADGIQGVSSPQLMKQSLEDRFDAATDPRNAHHLAVLATCTLAAYLILGGNPRRECPSCLWHPGAFARESINAKRHDYANKTQRAIIERLGRKYGCHSCGVRSADKFHADHIPPSKLKIEGARVFFPQCKSCSDLQGASVSRNVKEAIPHTSLRPYHLWLPLGPLLLQAMDEEDEEEGRAAGHHRQQQSRGTTASDQSSKQGAYKAAVSDHSINEAQVDEDAWPDSFKGKATYLGHAIQHKIAKVLFSAASVADSSDTSDTSSDGSDDDGAGNEE